MQSFISFHLLSQHLSCSGPDSPGASVDLSRRCRRRRGRRSHHATCWRLVCRLCFQDRIRKLFLKRPSPCGLPVIPSGVFCGQRSYLSDGCPLTDWPPPEVFMLRSLMQSDRTSWNVLDGEIVSGQNLDGEDLLTFSAARRRFNQNCINPTRCNKRNDLFCSNSAKKLKSL